MLDNIIERFGFNATHWNLCDVITVGHVWYYGGLLLPKWIKHIQNENKYFKYCMIIKYTNELSYIILCKNINLKQKAK